MPNIAPDNNNPYSARLFECHVFAIVPNSVLSLRQESLTRAKRPYMARGSKTERCPQCLLRPTYCVCTKRPKPQGNSAFLMLMYWGEVFKPSNTGRLIADVVADNYAFEWTRTEIEPALLALLNDERYAPMVVFPHQYAQPKRCIHSPLELSGVASGQQKPLFIMLDGTWREAKKMFKSSYLDKFPVLGIAPTQASAYQLREAAHEHQLCTVEVAVEVLRLAKEQSTAAALGQYFADFRHHYLTGKANAPL